MKRVILLILVVVVSYTYTKCQQTSTDNEGSKYFNETPPGLTPKPFAREFLNRHCGVYATVIFNKDFTQACWTPNGCDDYEWKGGLFLSYKINNQWADFKEVMLLGEEYSHRSPYYSADGETLYFQGHLKEKQGRDQQERFYYSEKVGEGWSEPILLDEVFNKFSVHWQFSVDKDQNLYFGGTLRGVDHSAGIYFSKYTMGRYQEPILIFKGNDYPDAIFAPAISPDGDYLIFTRINPRGSSSPRIFSLYVSFRDQDHQWSEPKELGQLLRMDGNQARISADGKYIFFVDNNKQVYWVSANIIKQLKNKTSY